MSVVGVILAGGLSRRMGGGDKSLLDLEGRPPLARVIERFRPQTDLLAINANGDADRFTDHGLPVIADTVEGFVGPLAGVLAGMRWAAAQNASHIVTAASDTPFLPGNLVERLKQATETDTQIAMASSDGRLHPVFGLWPVSLADALEHFLVGEDKRKILEFANRSVLHEVVFASQPTDPFFNINTPEDLAKARKIAEEFE